MMPKLAHPRPVTYYIERMEEEVKDLKRYLTVLDPDVDVRQIRDTKMGIARLEAHIINDKMDLEERRNKNG